MDAILLYIEFINQYINSNYYYSIVIFFMFLTFYSTLSIPGGVILFISSGFFFNLYLGFFINLFSISIGSIIFHISCKFILKFFFPIFYLNYSQKVTNIIKNSSNEYLILFRMIPGPPLFVQNLCLSIINISKVYHAYKDVLGFYESERDRNCGENVACDDGEFEDQINSVISCHFRHCVILSLHRE